VSRYFFAQALTPGFCAPILWGVRQGIAVAEIAAGLELDPALVVVAIEENSPVRFPPPARQPVPLEPKRRDPAYRAWMRSRQGAAAALRAGAPP
jgi:hypothetical protein